MAEHGMEEHSQRPPRVCHKTAALTVPILPHTSPMAPSPPSLKLPLHPHQRRALHRCLLIESDGSLQGDFGHLYDYKSRGGVLADAVGTGKTATSIALALAGERGNGGDTLVVAPSHLIPQWRDEIRKFAPPDVLEVVVGVQEYELRATFAPAYPTRRIVLVDVDTVLQSSKLWYDFRRVFTEPRSSRESRQVFPGTRKLELYRKAANFCVQSPRGPCSYDGWVYTSPLHLPQRPWRRVIFDEIQDLVREGTESQKNLMQLSRTADHVWLLSATPFPHGNRSVFANHELLGFCRLRLDVEVTSPLPCNHTFEVIKRKLYIRSPRHVADEAVTATKAVTRKTELVERMDAEAQFYGMEMEAVRESLGLDGVDGQARGGKEYFRSAYDSIRQMTVHPEASEELRRQAMGDDQATSDNVGRFSSVSSFARVSLNRAKRRSREVTNEIPRVQREADATERSLELARAVKAFRESPVGSNPFANGVSGVVDASDREKGELAVVHSAFCTHERCHKHKSVWCNSDKHVHFRTIPDWFSGQEFIRGNHRGANGATEQVAFFFKTYCPPNRTVDVGGGQVPALDYFISVTQRTVANKRDAVERLEREKARLEQRVEVLSGIDTSRRNIGDDHGTLAFAHGSKPAALVRYLRVVAKAGERAIVFSYWHDTLKLVQRTLRKCDVECSFCEGNGAAMSRALTAFTSGQVPVLLLSAQAKASGANLQCATHVVLLDPPGSSPEDGAALESQAVGRAVRMGQDKAVTVTRFCVTGTVESDMFHHIDAAATMAAKQSNDESYTIEAAHKELPAHVLTKADEGAGDKADVKVTKSLSASERVKRQCQEAEVKGLVINLIDSDEEEQEEKKVEHAASMAATATANDSPSSTATEGSKQAIVKSEASSAKSSSNQIASSSVLERPQKQNEAVNSGTRRITRSITKAASKSTNAMQSISSQELNLLPRRINVGDMVVVSSRGDKPGGAGVVMNVNRSKCNQFMFEFCDVKYSTGRVESSIDSAFIKSQVTNGEPEESTKKSEEAPADNVSENADSNGSDGTPSSNKRSAWEREVQNASINGSDRASPSKRSKMGQSMDAGEEESSPSQNQKKQLRGQEALAADEEPSTPNAVAEEASKNGAVRSDPVQESILEGRETTPRQESVLPSSEPSSSAAATPDLTQTSVSDASSVGNDGDNVNSKNDDGMEGIRSLLARSKLEQYEQKFIEAGYNDLEWLCVNSSDLDLVEKVAEDVGFKPGHAIRFQSVLAREAQSRVSP